MEAQNVNDMEASTTEEMEVEDHMEGDEVGDGDREGEEGGEGDGDEECGLKLLGENSCPAYKNNESACIDLFFNVVPSSTTKELHQYLEASWSESAELTLRILFNLGNVRREGAGKQDRTNFYRGMLWLWRRDPKTVILNARQIPGHSSLKDLLNLYMYIVHLDASSAYSLETQITAAREHKAHRKSIRTPGTKKERRRGREARRLVLWSRFAQSLCKTTWTELRQPRNAAVLAKVKPAALSDPRVATEWISADIADQFHSFCRTLDKERAEQSREEKRVQKQTVDSLLRECRQQQHTADLRTQVVNVFVDGLQAELAELDRVRAGDSKKSIGGLFGKWAPKERGMHDRATGITGDIIRALLPRLGQTAEYGTRKYQELLSQLHESAQVPEHYVGSARWAEVNYNRMASRCRLLWGKKVFMPRDKERYRAYLEQSAIKALTKKEAKDGVKTGALLPHELIARVMKVKEEDDVKDKMTRLETNLQWWGLIKSTREALRAGEGLGACLPMCDVSGSMDGTPMEVAVALSMLLAESAPRDSPLNAKILTFESEPKLCRLDNVPDYDMVVDSSNLEDIDSILRQLGDLRSRVAEVVGYDWGGSTNIEAAYNLLLKLATANKLSPAYVANICLIIFSDMEFDEAITEGYSTKEDAWATMHERIKKKFLHAGYPTLPRTVFWNLRASCSQPVRGAKAENVVLLSGFSAGLLRSFLKGSWEDFNPLAQMLQALSGPLYQLLRVAQPSPNPT